MIDIHCHILPGIDDGPDTMDESVAMCRMAEQDGIHTIVATPHFSPEMQHRTADDLFDRIGKLESALEREQIRVRILPGADVAIFPELPDRAARERHLTIGGTGKYLLAEFPFGSVPRNWKDFLRALLDSGAVPVVTHPERHGWFLRHPEALYAIVEMGGMVQITAMSVTGGFGEDARRFCNFLLKHGLVHVIATDAHSIDSRPPLLSEAVNAASFQIPRERVMPLVTSIPAAIVEGRPVQLPPPVGEPDKKPGLLQRLLSRRMY